MLKSLFSSWRTSRPLLLIAGVIATGMAVTVWTWHSLHVNEQEAARIRFEQNVSDTLRSLNEAMSHYERLLHAGSSLFASSGDVSRQQWHAFVESLRLEDLYPGAKGFGYAPLVQASDLPAHTAAIRAEGFPHYAVTSLGHQSALTPVLYLEPFIGQNLKAFGFDMYSEAVRREAMNKARDTGLPVLSGKVTLVQEDQNSQAGALMFQPVYRPGVEHFTQAQRRAALQGFVYLPFRMNELIMTVLDERVMDIALEIYDGETTAPNARLFEHLTAVLQKATDYTPVFVEQRTLQVGSHLWTLRLTALPAFETASSSSHPSNTLIAGTALTLLSSLFLASLFTTRTRAEALAASMSSAFRESEARIRSIVEGAAEGILVTDNTPELNVLSLNPATEHILRLSSATAIGQPLLRLLKPQDSLSVEARLAEIRSGSKKVVRFDIQSLNAHGRPIPLSVSITTTQQDEALRLIVMISDLTELHQAQRSALEASTLSETIFIHAPFCILATDPHGTITSLNPAGEQLLGYSRHELIGQQNATVFHDEAELNERAAQLSEKLGRPVSGNEALFVLARQNIVEEREWTYMRKDGSRIAVNLAINALREADGKVNGYIGIAYDITERKRNEDNIRHLALHDPLTGLPNRNLMIDRMAMSIERAKRNNDMIGVMVLDLDGFKDINDTLGHDVGDKVLKHIAQRLKQSVRQSDTVIRTGGDEFVILLGELRQVEDTANVANKVLKSVDTDLIIDSHRLKLSTSIGIALYPKHGRDLDTLIKSADMAMYEVKKRGKNSYQLALTASRPAAALQDRLL
ncbi:PAS domain S-box-containing protein/diguanylate cyclase (GGDEF)-like protein [Pseudomonas duriflava]|uniref:PAS domain S-box-containing protein/diguanylate cyclase (GGDEF)-like protein n=1 Tax=Pseudomonas duriflava TaxID=459528 RepID=A0A562QJ20_9PSED|nr:CHASE domain-containing protein [Pseudomonas duriflava]TWI56734.1 PAS domain S-box-containing protein/diguanylate cyclase (GGDEF)-like protein [Pseudomonas duriflava]